MIQNCLKISGILMSFLSALMIFACAQENKTSNGELSLTSWTHILVDSTRTRIPGKSNGGGGWFGLAMGDITGNGYNDIVSGAWFYRNPGGEMTAEWQRITLFDTLDALLVVDVDGDEYGDVIAAWCEKQYWLEAQDKQGNTWNRTLVGTLPVCDHRTSSQGYNLAQIVAGGKPEILLTGVGIYYMEIPDNPETGNWPATVVAEAGSNGEWVSASDMDNDGQLDVCAGFMVGEEGIGVAWWRNPGDGSEPWQQFKIGETQFHGDKFIGADVNGDGRKDMVVTEERYPGKEPDASMYWFEAPVDPTTPDWPRHTIVTQYSMNNLDVADLDRDGDADIVTCEHKGPKEKLQIWENDGKANFTVHVIDEGKESHLGAILDDLDHDGDLDIVSIAWEDFQYLHVWRNDAIRGQ